jgi:tetratricopeptide (TPR) repeat protein
MPKKGTLFETDLRALAEYVDTLLRCYSKAGRLDELPSVLERLRDNINDVAWQRKTTYFHALAALGEVWDERAGRRELKKLGKVTHDDDAETLQLYLDLFGDTLSFSEKQEIIDWILAVSEELSDRLHYVGSRAVLYFTIGDRKRAEEELDQIIQEARSTDNRDLSAYTRHRLAMSMDLLGTIRSDQATLEEAASIYETLLEDDLWTERGRADLLAELGQNYQHQSNWEAAKTAFSKAIDIAHVPIHSVFLSQSLLHLNQPDEAARILSDVSFDALAPAEQVDCAFTIAALAIRTGNKSKLDEAKVILKSVRPDAPMFREMRDDYLLSVQESLSLPAPRLHLHNAPRRCSQDLDAIFRTT